MVNLLCSRIKSAMRELMNSEYNKSAAHSSSCCDGNSLDTHIVILPPPNMMENTYINKYIYMIPRAEGDFKSHDTVPNGV